MAAPDLLSKVGFEKTKVGSGDKETGYQVSESSLSSLLGSACLCFLIMGLMVVSMVFDIHFEKKTIHRQIRQEEHHAARKLAEVQMELWSEFHSDIQESQEAKALLLHMNQTYTTFQGKIKGVVSELSAELNLNPVKAEKFADKLLHVVADFHQENTKHAKHLVDHLVQAGKRSKKLEKHVDKAMLKEAKEETKLMEADKAQGIEINDSKDNGTDDEQEDKNEMQVMLEGFFNTFHDFEKEFNKEVTEKMQEGQTVYDQVKKLHERLNGSPEAGGAALSDEDILEELNKIDLASVGAALGSGRVLDSSADIVEELYLIPKLPREKLSALEKEWKKGEKDPMVIFEQLTEWHEQGLVPGGWLQMGAAQEMKDEMKEEEKKMTA
mmetsp:Transcript_84756/g.155389  ORF Transcript_84756/g.155389 Transcript_84756/m.155389 type:complete len:382 (+) Transcript_84756:54-1199(+)